MSPCVNVNAIVARRFWRRHVETLLPSTTRVRRHRFIDLITSQLDAGYIADRRVKALET